LKFRGGQTIEEKRLEELRKSYQLNDALKKGTKKINYKLSDKIDLGGKTKGVDELFSIPDNWRWVSLGQVTWSITDGPHFSPKYVDDGIPIISSRNISVEHGLNFSSAKYVSNKNYHEFI